jgi:hypothetical protein
MVQAQNGILQSPRIVGRVKPISIKANKEHISNATTKNETESNPIICTHGSMQMVFSQKIYSNISHTITNPSSLLKSATLDTKNTNIMHSHRNLQRLLSVTYEM